MTGQAFEDMQEQNGRLLQQLREKDDANFKLMSERIKANQIHKLLREEKDELGEQVLGLKSQVRPLGLQGGAEGPVPPALIPSCPQVDAQLLTVQKLEEKERALQGSLGGVEKELTLRSQALELNKRKVRPGCGRAPGRAPTLPVLTPLAQDVPTWSDCSLAVVLQGICYCPPSRARSDPHPDSWVSWL